MMMKSTLALLLIAAASARLPGQLRPTPLVARKGAAVLSVPRGGGIGIPGVDTTPGAIPAWYFLAGVLLHKQLEETAHMTVGLTALAAVAFAHAAYAVVTHWSAVRAAAAERWNGFWKEALGR